MVQLVLFIQVFERLQTAEAGRCIRSARQELLRKAIRRVKVPIVPTTSTTSASASTTTSSRGHLVTSEGVHICP